MIEFFGDLWTQWGGWWQGFSEVLQYMSEYGTRGIRESMQTYGPQNPSANPTTRLIGVIYILSSIIPSLTIFYLFFRYRFLRRTALVLASVTQVVVVFMTRYVLLLRPPLGEAYSRFAYGPGAIIETITNHFSADPIGAFTVWVVVFGSFFIFSLVMWYFIIFSLWIFSMTFMSDPLFGDVSAKGHALWLTIIWFFFLSMSDPAIAWVQTIFLMTAVIINRSWDKRDFDLVGGQSGHSPGQEVIKTVSGQEPDPPETDEESDDEIQWI